jgi:putative transposase
LGFHPGLLLTAIGMHLQMQSLGGTILGGGLVRKLSMLLHPGSGYRVKDGYVEIIRGVKLKIIGWDRRYDQYENGGARLVYRGDKMMLWISKKIPKPQPYQPRDAIAVDINEKKIVYGDHVINGERDTKIDEAHRWKKLAENLQRKYPLDILHGGGENLY